MHLPTIQRLPVRPVGRVILVRTGLGLLLLIELGSPHRQLFRRIIVLHVPPVRASGRHIGGEGLLLHLATPVFVSFFNLLLQLILIPQLLLPPRIDYLRLLFDYPGVCPRLRGLVLLLLCD